MSYTYAALKPAYEAVLATVQIEPEYLPEIDAAINRLAANRARYAAVEAATGVPWYVVAVIHLREGSGDFRTHLHNGDPLTRRTVHVPAGRPVEGEPPFEWGASAIDAIRFDGIDKWRDWSMPAMCFVLERYNGFGYRARGVTSPYVWGYTTAYEGDPGDTPHEDGLFVSDGRYSASAVNRNPGAMTLILRMRERGLLDGSMQKPAPYDRYLCAKQMQMALQAAGLYTGTIDGKWGPKSRAAYDHFNQGG